MNKQKRNGKERERGGFVELFDMEKDKMREMRNKQEVVEWFKVFCFNPQHQHQRHS